MTLVTSLTFLTALALTAYAFYASVIPALPRIAELMADEAPVQGKPRMIYYGLDRRTARQMEEAKRLVALKQPRPVLAVARNRETPLRHAA